MQQNLRDRGLIATDEIIRSGIAGGFALELGRDRAIDDVVPLLIERVLLRRPVVPPLLWTFYHLSRSRAAPHPCCRDRPPPGSGSKV